MEYMILVIVAIVGFFYYRRQEEFKKIPEINRVEENKIQTEEENYIRSIFSPTTDNMTTMQALVFIAKADGQMREPECLVISEFLKSKQPEHINNTDSYMIERIREIKPLSTKEYKSFISALADDVNSFTLWVYKIFGTQKKNHPFEEYLIEELKQLSDKNRELINVNP